MEESFEKLGKAIALVVGICIWAFLFALFLKIGYNAIAWNFNLPQFDYWSCYFILLGIRAIRFAIAPLATHEED